MLTNLQRDSLREKAYAMTPIIQVGKNGITPAIILQIDKYLNKHKLMKVKLLPSCLGERAKDDVVKEFVKMTKTELVHQVGNVVVLYREK